MSEPLDLVEYNRRWVETHRNNPYQAEAARRITALLDEVVRLRIQAETAEQDRKLAWRDMDKSRARATAAEAIIARVRAALANHPRCEKAGKSS